MDKNLNTKKVVSEDDIDEVNVDQLHEELSRATPPYRSPRKKWDPKLSPINEHRVLNVKMEASTSNLSLKKEKKAKKNKAPKQPPVEYSQNSPKYLVKSKVCSPGKDRMKNAQNPSYSGNASHRRVPIGTANNDTTPTAGSSSAFKTKDNGNGVGTDAVIGFKVLSFTGKRENVNYDGINNENAKQISSILRDITDQMNTVIKKQDDINKEIKAINGMTSTDIKALGNKIFQLVESHLKVTAEKATEESCKNLASKIDNMFCEIENKLAGLVANQTGPNVLSNELVTLMKPSMDKAFKELYNSTVVPKSDKALNSMIEQIDDAVNQRSSYYNKEWNTFMKTIKANRNIPPRYDINRSLIRKFLGIVKKSEKAILKSYNGLFKHSPVLPNQETSVVDDIKQLIERGDIAVAFDVALSAIDLELVLFVCRNVTTPLDELFQSASMTPPIVLSLMQQLSFDLSNSTGIKHKYLDAAVRNLASSSKSHKKTAKSMLSHIDKEIEAFLNQDPQNPFCCRIEALQLIIKTKINLMA